jgi:hypothetical protein
MPSLCRASGSRSTSVCCSSCSRIIASIRWPAWDSVSASSRGRPRRGFQPPSESTATHARPSDRITGLAARYHLPYQKGPVARMRTNGRAVELGIVGASVAAISSTPYRTPRMPGNRRATVNSGNLRGQPSPPDCGILAANRGLNSPLLARFRDWASHRHAGGRGFESRRSRFRISLPSRAVSHDAVAYGFGGGQPPRATVMEVDARYLPRLSPEVLAPAPVGRLAIGFSPATGSSSISATLSPRPRRRWDPARGAALSREPRQRRASAGRRPKARPLWFRKGGGMPSVTLAPVSGRYLSVTESTEWSDWPSFCRPSPPEDLRRDPINGMCSAPSAPGDRSVGVRVRHQAGAPAFADDPFGASTVSPAVRARRARHCLGSR